MKIHNFISIILLLLFAVALVQCSKEVAKTEENELDMESNHLETRSVIPENVMISPECGPSDYLGYPLQCFDPFERTDTITTDLGCKIKVTMKITHCTDGLTGDIYVVFSDLRWNLIESNPFSTCTNWYLSMMVRAFDDETNEYDEFTKKIEQKFEDNYMHAYVRNNSIPCDSPFGRASALFFKSPCLQKCAYQIDIGFGRPMLFISEIPCADDGCCVKVTFYCYDARYDKVVQFGPANEQLAPCTNFINVDCGSGTAVGSCNNLSCL